jgi:predicted restriction endonuclease
MERRRRPWWTEFTRGTKKAVKRECGDTCQVCGQEGCTQVHHIVPVAHDGTRDPHNALCACPECHKELDRLALKERIYYPEAVIFIRERRK